MILADHHRHEVSEDATVRAKDCFDFTTPPPSTETSTLEAATCLQCNL